MLFSALVANEFRMGTDTNNTKTGSSDSKTSSKAGWILLGAAAVLLAGSFGYQYFDSGEGGDETEIAADGEPSLEALRAAAENSSEDAGPWAELGFAHFEREEFAESAAAYQRAVEIDDGEAVLWSALGEARAYAADAAEAAADPLPAEAWAAFERALELDPDDPRARFFFGVKQDLAGDHREAVSSWLALLSDSPPGAPWERDLVRTIEQVGAIHDIDVEQRLATIMEGRVPQVMVPGSGEAAGDAAASDLRGPTAQQVAEASRMAPGEQRAMAVGMVESLEARLQNEPQNLNGWVMLIRSRMNLGEPAKARAALEAAIAANPEEADELRRQAEQFGVR